MKFYIENLEHFIFVVSKEINKDTYMSVLPAENTPHKIVIKKVLDPVLKKVRQLLRWMFIFSNQRKKDRSVQKTAKSSHNILDNRC